MRKLLYWFDILALPARGNRTRPRRVGVSHYPKFTGKLAEIPSVCWRATGLLAPGSPEVRASTSQMPSIYP